METKILELQNVTKVFPGVKALDNVQFDLRQGEIHCLMGENGAGKSTFIKVITGVHAPDEGEMLLGGEPVLFRTPREAYKAGIAAIYQHVTAYPDLTVAENIFMGHERVTPWTRRIDWARMHREAQDLLDSLDANFSSRERMGNLSVARQQIVEIAKALSAQARVLVMDEPTAALTRYESEELYRITEDLRNSGVSIIFISHRMEDIWRLADRVTVFRDGRYIDTWEAREITQHDLVVAMVGREISHLFPKRKVKTGDEILRVEKLGRRGFFQDISFSLKQGEILALTGLVGAGRTEVCEALYGVCSWDSGRVFLEGAPYRPGSPRQALEAGIGALPEDRQLEGLILQWEIGKNISLASLGEVSRRGWIQIARERDYAGGLAKKLSVKAPSIFTRVAALSGGNQQKVVVAKILSRDLKVIILDEPTKGVDVGAKAAIYEIIGDLAEQGYGIILVSSEMPEVLGLSDRIVVMKRGRVTAHMETARATQEEILRAAMVSDQKEMAHGEA
ncbi:D-ribose transporter ATP-binding protein [Alkalispirochaeta sphaeroplastigenens]|uniref:D-ribose transporter ATP-binding protein n=1 Tax=Alkalispirochaeta sphaeroplastigenens TaxID=1187066 RepID=A0A2S4JHB9_9SPIO|nr:sugar ABC transporter ATP-binding protein [Alkalispirochaeta sphaeroplastigenens]POQ98958.1 D-ribose transporter ATP-binding protein [Alkalispirochaeta sphaeroplastigenens]